VDNGSGYKFYHSKKGLIESRDAIFLKNINQITPTDALKFFQDIEDPSIYSPLNSRHETDLQLSRSIKRKFDNLSHMDTEDKNNGSKRQREPSIKLKDHYVLSVDDINLQDDPMNFKEAMNSIDADKWIEVMNNEIDSIRNNDVWEITDLSSQRKTIGCK